MNAGSMRQIVWGAVLIALTLGMGILGLHTGSMDFSSADIWHLLTHPKDPDALIIWDLRMPRLLLAFCSGAVLSLGGFFMQALIKNPLADPYIMGLTAGAGLGVNLLILGLIPIGSLALGYPLVAGLGGLLSLALVLALGWKALAEDGARLLIAGVAVASLCTAITGLLIYTQADSDQVRRVIFWSFGSFHRADWNAVQVAGVLLLIAATWGWAMARRLDVLGMGDQQAQSLGLPVLRFKLILLLITSLTVGGTVAFTGPIGFVGMMVPHVSRALFGASHRPNMLLAPLLGGSYLVSCDILARWILPPAGLPIGIITALLGVPFFLYLLRGQRGYL